MSDFDVLGTVGKLALPTFCKVPRICGKSELRTCEIWPREQRSTGVFLVRFGGQFSDRGFRLDRGNSWRSESSTLCTNVSSFQCTRACGSTCCESGRLCAQAWQRRGESSGNFQQQPYFVGLFSYARGRRSSRCRISAILVSSESLCYLLFKGTGLAQRRAWDRKIDPANRGRWNVPYAKGSFSDLRFRLDRRSS
uniref:Uncharacterized protein n=1 Tax=Fagus sylvatica TaxID=28930 RepID=A0A2N9GEG5_FAGSY